MNNFTGEDKQFQIQEGTRCWEGFSLSGFFLVLHCQRKKDKY